MEDILFILFILIMIILIGTIFWIFPKVVTVLVGFAAVCIIAKITHLI